MSKIQRSFDSFAVPRLLRLNPAAFHASGDVRILWYAGVRGWLNLETAPRTVGAVAAFADRNLDNLGDETLHREADSSMRSRQCGQRTARALDRDLTVGFHPRERAEMLVHQLAGFADASAKISARLFPKRQFSSEAPAGLSKKPLQLVWWQSFRKNIDELCQQRDVRAGKQLLDFGGEFEDQGRPRRPRPLAGAAHDAVVFHTGELRAHRTSRKPKFGGQVIRG